MMIVWDSDMDRCSTCGRALFVDSKSCVIRLTGRSRDINAGRTSTARFAEIASRFCSTECEARGE